MDGEKTYRRRRRSQLAGSDGDRHQLFDRARDVASKQLAQERDTVTYRSHQDQQAAMKQRNQHALEQTRSEQQADRQVADRQLTEKMAAERGRLVRGIADQRGKKPNMRQGASSPGTGQGGVLGTFRKRNPRRYLLQGK